MSDTRKKKIMNRDNVLKVISLAAAIVIWVVVTLAISPNYTRDIGGVVVRLEQSQGQLALLNLTSQWIEPRTVTVTVTGNRTVVSRLSPEDIVVNANAGGVLVAGEYDLQLIAEVNGDIMGELVISVSPSAAKVKFDRRIDRQFDVEIHTAGNLTVPEGYVLGTPKPSVSTIRLTGPENEIARVSRCVVTLNEEQALNATTSRELPVVLLDASDKEITLANTVLSVETIDVTVPVLKMKTLPMKLDVQNIPLGMTQADLRYTITPVMLAVAGPEDVVDTIDFVSVGYLDLREVGLEFEESRSIQLRSDLLNLDDIEVINIKFDTSGLEERSFNLSNIRYVNERNNYTYTIVSKRISNVTVVGNAQQLESLLAEDMIAEIDLKDFEHREGQFNLPVRIVFLKEGVMWAYGEYWAVLDIKEK